MSCSKEALIKLASDFETRYTTCASALHELTRLITDLTNLVKMVQSYLTTCTMKLKYLLSYILRFLAIGALLNELFLICLVGSVEWKALKT